MKKLFLLFLLECFVLGSKAQIIDNAPFCPPGATWIGYINGFGADYKAVYQYEKDTVIVGLPCKKIKSSLITIFSSSSRGVTSYPPEFWRYENDSLTAWNGTYFEFWGAYDSTLGKQYVVENQSARCRISTVPNSVQDSFFILGRRDFTDRGITYLGCKYQSTGGKFKDFEFRRRIGLLNGLFPTPNPTYCNGVVSSKVNGIEGVFYFDNIRGFPTAFTARDSAYYHFILTSVEEVIGKAAQKIEVNIYPNPTKDVFQIVGAEQLKSIELIDINGKTVLKKSVDLNSIDISPLINGLYIVRYYGKDDSVSTTKLVKI